MMNRYKWMDKARTVCALTYSESHLIILWRMWDNYSIQGIMSQWKRYMLYHHLTGEVLANPLGNFFNTFLMMSLDRESTFKSIIAWSSKQQNIAAVAELTVLIKIRYLKVPLRSHYKSFQNKDKKGILNKFWWFGSKICKWRLKTAVSVWLRLFIDNNEKCNTFNTPHISLSSILFSSIYHRIISDDPESPEMTHRWLRYGWSTRWPYTTYGPTYIQIYYM